MRRSVFLFLNSEQPPKHKQADTIIVDWRGPVASKFQERNQVPDKNRCSQSRFDIYFFIALSSILLFLLVSLRGLSELLLFGV